MGLTKWMPAPSESDRQLGQLFGPEPGPPSDSRLLQAGLAKPFTRGSNGVRRRWTFWAALALSVGACGSQPGATPATQDVAPSDAASSGAASSDVDGSTADTAADQSGPDGAGDSGPSAFDAGDAAAPPDTTGSGSDAEADTTGGVDTPNGDSWTDAATGAGDTSPDAGSDATAGSDAAVPPATCAAADDCPSAGPCLLPLCSPKHQCQFVPASDGAPCSDGNACTTLDHCSAGQCQGGAALACDDQNPCTADQCNPVKGCINLPTAATAGCDDGDPCTSGDTCMAGQCQPGVAICQCKTTSDCAKYEDGNLCNGSLYCDTSSGAPFTCNPNPASVVVCPGGQDNACQKNTCVPATGECKLLISPKNTPCDDGDSCTSGDVCDQGLCQGGQNTCYCKTDADCASQEDGNLCNGVLFCNKALAQCQVNPVSVVTCQTVDNTFCTQNLCNPKDGKCYYVPVHEGKSCDDGNPCTPNESCQSGQCQTATNTCECQNDMDCLKKDDGDPCNGALYCDLASKKCMTNPATVVHCNTDDDPPCLSDVCDPKTGKCSLIALPKDGTPCDDGNSCTPGSWCQSGQCAAQTNTCECQKDADCLGKEDGDLCNGTLYCDQASNHCLVNPASVVECPSAFDEACLTNQCDKKTGSCGMKPAHQGNQCGSDSPCTAGGWCSYGSCDAPIKGVCQCESDSDCAKLEDGNLCNGTLYCDKTGTDKASKAPQCKVNPATEVVCPTVDDTACQKNTCQPKSGVCQIQVISATCNDGDPCTLADVCKNGGCAGTAVLCEDGDPCTSDTCIKGFGCVALAAAASTCDDGNVCTTDSCVPKLGCVHGYAPGSCDDGSACTGSDACKDGKCVGVVLTCDDGVTCSADSCDPTAGCQHTPVGDGGTCSDGNACTGQDACKGGKCVGVALSCDDKNPCTSDGCDPNAGCTAAAAPGGCDDGNACTSGDSCKSGNCVGTAKTCDDGAACTTDACTPAAGCQFLPVPDGNACSDGSACTTLDACKAGKCAGSILSCDDNNPCTADSCDPTSGCTSAATGGGCDDGNACTSLDHCQGGACLGGGNACDDQNPCTDDSCKAGACSHAANSAPCTDGSACTTQDTCQGAVCVGGTKLDCDDKNSCTFDGCAAASGCLHAVSAATCDDGDACTSGDACQNLDGVGLCRGATLDCNDQNLCTSDSCDKIAGCQHSPNTAPCNDGDACTTQDACKDGNCAAGKAKNCDDGNICTQDLCVAASGACANTDVAATLCDDGKPCTDDLCHPILGCSHVNNAAACSDGDACTTGDGCSGGKCSSTGTQTCSDAKVCTDDSCDPKQGCVFTPNSAACNDGLGCTVSDTCKDGSCTGKLSCDDQNSCTADSCDFGTATCAHQSLDGQTCDDGDACTAESLCKSSTCQATKPKTCDDGNLCTDDSCDKLKGCQTVNNTASCSTGTCTGGDACAAGSCKSSGKALLHVWNYDDPDYNIAEDLWHVAPVADGGWVAVGARRNTCCGASQDALVVRFGPAGTVSWTKVLDFSSGSYDWAEHVSVEANGTLVVLGSTNTALEDGFVARLSLADGSLLSKAIWVTSTTAVYEERVWTAARVVTANGVRWLAAGGRHVNAAGANADGFVTQVASDGTVDWTVILDDNPGNTTDLTVTGVASTPDGGFYLAGSTNAPSSAAGADGKVASGLGSQDIFLARYDSKRVLQWFRRLGGNNFDFAHGVATLADGGAIVTGTFGGLDAYIARVDGSGTTTWSTQIDAGSGGYDYGGNPLIWPDGTVGLCWWGAFQGNGPWPNISRYDPAGKLLWNKTYTTSSPVEFAQLALLPGGGLIGVGSLLYGASRGGLLVRADPWGESSCGVSKACAEKDPATCDDGEPCTWNSGCDGSTGACLQKSATGACQDGNACTNGDTCQNSVCTGGPAVLCNDNNPCTADWCDTGKGCQTSTYPDGFACATGKTCLAGVCQ